MNFRHPPPQQDSVRLWVASPGVFVRDWFVSFCPIPFFAEKTYLKFWGRNISRFFEVIEMAGCFRFAISRAMSC